MKRSIHQVNPLPAEGSPPAIKRAFSESKLSEDDSKPEGSFYLIHQNRELSKELKRKQMKIDEYEEQSSFYNDQIVKIEEFLGFIDRVWHQFEFDLSILSETLGCPGEPHQPHQQEEDGGGGETGAEPVPVLEDGEGGAMAGEDQGVAWSSLLHQYLDANRSYFESIPCAVSDELDIDEWSNEPEIDEARIRGLEACLDSSSGLDVVKEELVSRLEFTKKNVEKLYEMVNHQTEGQLAALLTPLTEDRNIRTELDLLRDQVTKYKHEVITISAEMAHLRRKLKKTEKLLLEGSYASGATGGTLVRTASTPSLATTSVEKKENLEAVATVESEESMNVVEEIARETPLCLQNGEIVDSRLVIGEAVSKLQQQLEEAQQRMVSAEKSLTDYMATAPGTPQPTNHSSEIARLQKLLTEVRTVSNKKLADVRAEKSTLMTKISDLERAMIELITRTEAKIDQMAIACAEELAKEKNEKDKIQLALLAAEAEVKLMANMQTQVTEMQTIHDTSKSKLDKLTERLKSHETTISLLESHLTSSKQREEALELSLKAIADAPSQEGNTKPSHSRVEEEEEGVVHEDKEQQSSQLISQLLTNSQSRCRELEGQLADAKANMDELIVEIEGVATEEERTRTQNSRLLKQISEGHNVHKAVLQENLRLHQDITTLQEKEALAASKVEIATSHMKVIETTLQQVRQAEQISRTDLISSISTLSELKIVSDVQHRKIEDLENKLQESVDEAQRYQDKLVEIRDRCNQLTMNCEEERNKRLELERLRDEDKRQREKEANKISILMAKAAENESKSDQSTMLEMTLSMLRCSVCKDRFKQVAITKCFHLFCKECINENLKNRNRKCPACGEKFGQEDVKSVFFAH